MGSTITDDVQVEKGIRTCMEEGCKTDASWRVAKPIKWTKSKDGGLEGEIVLLYLCTVHYKRFRERE